mgnify:CR=1 FL=1
MKKFTLKRFKNKRKSSKAEIIDIVIFFILLLLSLIVFFFTRKMIYSAVMIIIAICIYLFKNTLIEVFMKKRKEEKTYLKFYNSFFNILDTNHNVKEALYIAINNMTNDSFISNVKDKLDNFNEKRDLNLNINNSFDEGKFLMLLKRGLIKNHVNSSFINNLYEYYKKAYLDLI